MKPYELMVVLHPDLEIDADTPITKIEALIKGAGGNVTKRDNSGKKRLAYPIKKQLFGIYVYFELDLEPQGVRVLDEQLRITEEVMRHLIVTKVVTQRRSDDRPAKKEVTPAEAGPAKEEK
jgi:small subunit ribosomal protein S6